MQEPRNLDARARRGRRKVDPPRPPSQAFWDGFSDGFWLTMTPSDWTEFTRRSRAAVDRLQARRASPAPNPWEAVGASIAAAMRAFDEPRS